MEELLQRFDNLIQVYKHDKELGLELIKGFSDIECVKLLISYLSKSWVKDRHVEKHRMIILGKHNNPYHWNYWLKVLTDSIIEYPLLITLQYERIIRKI